MKNKKLQKLKRLIKTEDLGKTLIKGINKY